VQRATERLRPRGRVRQGPASFVVRADGDERFAEAVRKKLLLEIAGPRDGRSPALRLAQGDDG
jgi:Protein of unknown function (DUF1194)